MQPGDNFIYNSSHYFEIDSESKNYVSDIDHKYKGSEFSTVRNDEFDLNSIENTGLSESRSHVGWRCILNYNEKNNGSYKRNSTYRGIAEKCDPLDCGHILGLGLFQYIEPRQKLKKQESRSSSSKKKLQEICNDANNNLFPQFPRANRNQKNDVGQLRFEELVRDYLTHHRDDKVYYEVEKIYSNPNSDLKISAIPIGTRIFASSTDKCTKLNSREELSLPFHVFIPNYAVSDSEWQSGNKDYDLDYLLENNDSKIKDLYDNFYSHNWK